jgi:hypothetical protein
MFDDEALIGQFRSEMQAVWNEKIEQLVRNAHAALFRRLVAIVRGDRGKAADGWSASRDRQNLDWICQLRREVRR